MILVVGATGDLGGAIAHTLLAQGKQVRVLVRPQSNYQPLVEVGAQAVFGDLKDRASLDAACAGAATVVTTANSARRGGEDNVETVDLKGNRSLIDAARAAGVQHFIFISAGPSHPDHPIPFIAAKAQTEEHLQASGMAYTILVPTSFAEVWPMMVVAMPVQAGRPVTVVGSGERKHAFISAADVAAFAVAAVDNPAAINRRLPLCGPAGYSYRDVAKLFEGLLNCTISVRSVTPAEAGVVLPELIAGLLAWQDTHDAVWDMADTARTFSVELTPLEQVLRRMLAPAAG